MLKWLKNWWTGRDNYNYRISTDTIGEMSEVIEMHYYPNQGRIWFTFKVASISFPSKKDLTGFFKDLSKELSKAFDEVKK